jgi:hypothetical protein
MEAEEKKRIAENLKVKYCKLQEKAKRRELCSDIINL